MEYQAQQQYTNAYATRYAVKPRQPMFGKRAISTISTLFVYDIISPYGMGANVVSNPDQDVMTMVGWGMICHMSILCPGAATLTVQADLGDGTFTEMDYSPIALALSTKIQVVDFPVVPCFFFRVRLAGDGSTYTFHSSIVDY